MSRSCGTYPLVKLIRSVLFETEDRPARSIRRATTVACFVASLLASAPSTAQEPPPPEATPFPAPTPVPGAPAEAQSLADIPDEAWTDEPEPEPDSPLVRQGVVWLPYLGIAFAGSGTLKAELDCRAGADCASRSQESDYSQNPNLLLGIDTLVHVLPALRVGLGLQWIPTSDGDVEDGESSAEFGDELSTTAVVEGVFGGKSAGVLRGFVGANFLFPGGELQELIDGMDAECRSIGGGGGSCSVASGPYTGLTLGAAAAFLRQLGETSAARFELSLQYVRFSGPRLEVSDAAGNRYEDALSWSALRLSLRFGVEF